MKYYWTNNDTDDKSIYCRFMMVLICLIFSVLSTIEDYDDFAMETLFWMVCYLFSFSLSFSSFFLSSFSLYLHIATNILKKVKHPNDNTLEHKYEHTCSNHVTRQGSPVYDEYCEDGNEVTCTTLCRHDL